MRQIDELKAVANALEPTHPVECRMLKDALKGDWATGLHRKKQEELIRIHKAKQKITEAIALLEGEGERAMYNYRILKTAEGMKVAPGELRPAAALLVCEYYGFTELFLKDGLWYAFDSKSLLPIQLGQHLWLELCKTEPTEWIKAKIQEIESDRYASCATP